MPATLCSKQPDRVVMTALGELLTTAVAALVLAALGRRQATSCSSA